MDDLKALLPAITPKAIAWAQTQEALARVSGRALDAPFLTMARMVGVTRPEHIRILDVQVLPLPTDPLLHALAVQTGFTSPDMVGLTLGYAVFVRPGYGSDPRLLSHEFRHVQQYEQANGISGFLPLYLQQIVTYGYKEAPFERDARAHERHRL